MDSKSLFVLAGPRPRIGQALFRENETVAGSVQIKVDRHHRITEMEIFVRP